MNLKALGEAEAQQAQQFTKQETLSEEEELRAAVAQHGHLL